MSLAKGSVITATYELVTPGFCAGASQKTAEIRIPSIKGVLRFWWRALAWSRYKGLLPRIRSEEAALFGAASSGQSRVLLRYRGEQLKATDVSLDGIGLRYLGYGAIGRKSLEPGLAVEVEAFCRTDLDDDQAETLRLALVALGLLGGIGSRSRNGFGSLSLQKLRIGDEVTWQPPTDGEALRDMIEEVFQTALVTSPPQLPPYTAFSTKSRYLLVEDQSDSLDLLDALGTDVKQWIEGGGPAQATVSIAEVARHRSPFGLPRHYDGSQLKPTGTDRRATPLFLHLHRLPGGESAAVLSFLPAQFLPGHAVVTWNGTKVPLLVTPTSEGPRPEPVDLYRSLTPFLDDLAQRRSAVSGPNTKGQP